MSHGEAKKWRPEYTAFTIAAIAAIVAWTISQDWLSHHVAHGISDDVDLSEAPSGQRVSWEKFSDELDNGECKLSPTGHHEEIYSSFRDLTKVNRTEIDYVKCGWCGMWATM